MAAAGLFLILFGAQLLDVMTVDVSDAACAGDASASLLQINTNKTDKKKFLAVLLRNGGPASPDRLAGISKTWGRDLEEGALTLLQPDADCKAKYGDNHWKGLTCLEAKAHMRLMNRTDFEWLLVVDDDTYVFADRLRETLRTMDSSKPEVYGAPYCGDCGNNLKGFCGGGGYVISRQSLLRMASSTEAPVASHAGDAFLQHFMRDPMSEWCDVRFGCVAQEKGLKAVGVKGMYGNGVQDAKGNSADTEGEAEVVELKKQDPPLVLHNVKDPPLVLHNVKDAAHMQRLHEESLREQAADKGETSAYNVKGLLKWVLLQVMS